MISNYIKMTLRNIKNQKGYSLINLSGLAVGMACCILILLFVRDELSFDSHHEKADRIYRIVTKGEVSGAQRNFALAPFAAGPASTEELPEVVNNVRMLNLQIAQQQILVTKDGENFDETGIICVDSTFFDIFTHEFVLGSAESALDAPGSVVITEDIRKKLYGDEDPMGQSFTITNFGDVTVTGVIKNVPKNSHFTFNYVISFSTIPAPRRAQLNQWISLSGYVYILLAEGADPEAVETKMAEIYEAKTGEIARGYGIYLNMQLQKLTDIHLRSHLEGEIEANNDIANVYIFLAVAVFILLIACINFMNLSTARSANRSKEVGLRKVFGAYKSQLVAQFLSESLLMSMFGLITALLVVVLVLPTFNNLTGKELTLDYLTDGNTVLWILGLMIFTGFFAGSYPAFFLSAFKPVVVLRGRLSRGSRSSIFRKILVVLQFTISVALISSTMIVLDQLYFMKNKNLGFHKEQIFCIMVQDPATFQRLETIKSEMKQNPNILEATFSNSVPGRLAPTMLFLPEGKQQSESNMFDGIFCDFDFLKTYGIELASGRDFSVDMSTDSSQAMIINETAAKKLGWEEDPLGKGLTNVSLQRPEGRIIGVVKDFHNKSLKQVIEPLVIAIIPVPQMGAILSMKINTDNISETVDFALTKWGEIEPDRTANYFFLDDDFDKQYRSEERMSEIFTYFAVITIMIACLGLFGLASFTAEQRTKEIGIRKTLGASVGNLFVLVSREFAVLVVIANIIALPLTWYGMTNYWLINFPFRVSPNVGTFLFAGLISILIAILTVSYQSIKAAIANPIKALRYE